MNTPNPFHHVCKPPRMARRGGPVLPGVSWYCRACGWKWRMTADGWQHITWAGERP